MNIFTEIDLSRNELNSLKEWVQSLDGMTSFFADIRKSSLVMNYSMLQELGGINDNLALHLYDVPSGARIARESLQGVLVKYKDMLGLKVTSTSSTSIELRIPGIERFIHFDSEGFALFPELIAHYLAQENIEPVLVKKWLLHTTFSEIDPKTHLYKDDMWELIENDAYLYAILIAERKMVLQGLHDVVDHAANAKSDGWTCASEIATEMRDKLRSHFQEEFQGNLPSHLIPLAAGVLLDELAQMPHYHSRKRITAIRQLLQKMDSANINPFAPLMLSDFPTSIDDITAAVRARVDPKSDTGLIQSCIDHYADEVRRLTYNPCVT